jgi:hypothetical protein
MFPRDTTEISFIEESGALYVRGGIIRTVYHLSREDIGGGYYQEERNVNS